MKHLQEIVYTGQFYHEAGGKRYYPQDPATTLESYKACVALAYGDLRGVTFGYDRSKVRTVIVSIEY